MTDMHAEIDVLLAAIREARDHIPDDDHPADAILAAALARKPITSTDA